MYVEDQSYTSITEDTIISGAGILIAAGVITAFIAVIGIVGTLIKARPMLIIVKPIIAK